VVGILISLAVLAVVVVVGSVLYRRWKKDLTAPSGVDVDAMAARLTGERLHRLGAPWRVVYEVPADRLGGIDHVLVGPPGVIAFVSSMSARPQPDGSPRAARTAAAAVTRRTVDELAARVGHICDLLVNVHWSTGDPKRPLADDVAHRLIAIDGQRLEEWIATMTDIQLVPAQIDLVWQAIVTGIGRSDPLT
jgi:hypothetical protein